MQKYIKLITQANCFKCYNLETRDRNLFSSSVSSHFSTCAVCFTIVVSVVDSSVGSQKLSKGSLCVHELLVGAHLCDFSIHHDQDQVGLGQVVQPMGHQQTSLHTSKMLFRM